MHCSVFGLVGKASPPNDGISVLPPAVVSNDWPVALFVTFSTIVVILFQKYGMLVKVLYGSSTAKGNQLAPDMAPSG